MGIVGRYIKIVQHILKVYRKGVVNVTVSNDFIVFLIKREHLIDFVVFLKRHEVILCEQLLDIWGVDYLGVTPRFELNYLFVSIKHDLRFIIKVRLEDCEGVASLVKCFKSASWLEREVWDMFGIYFSAHVDLRRILTDYGFSGFPLRKDFPLTGYLELRYDDGEKRIVLEPVELAQDFRLFSFLSPWEHKKQFVN